MDKRNLIGERTYPLKDGSSFTAKIYYHNARGLTLRIVYGTMELYVPRYATSAMIDKLVGIGLEKFPDRIINRPYLVPGVYAYVLGKKHYFSTDPKNKDSETYFYVPSNMKDPVTRYKKLFLDYVKPRAWEIGKRMGVDLSSYQIRTGLFLTYYGVCFPTKKEIKFDYRLYAYKPEISDSVIIHEIAHTFEIHHNDRFYTIVKLYCPNYDELEHDIDCGRFEGRMDNYVL
jgi:hypothetical protein